MNDSTVIPTIPVDRCEDCGKDYPAPVPSHHSKVECLRNQLSVAEQEEKLTQDKIRVVLSYVVHRARILLDCSTEHGRLVAWGKLKDAVAAAERLTR